MKSHLRVFACLCGVLLPACATALYFSTSSFARIGGDAMVRLIGERYINQRQDGVLAVLTLLFVGLVHLSWLVPLLGILSIRQSGDSRRYLILLGAFGIVFAMLAMCGFAAMAFSEMIPRGGRV